MLCVVLLACLVCDCGPANDAARYNFAVKNAFIMYTRRSPQTETPPLEVERAIYEYGKEDFANALVPALNTKYRVEAAYALGWFGDRRHVRELRELLSDSDAEVRRVSLDAVSRLVHMRFQSAADAATWLSENEKNLP